MFDFENNQWFTPTEIPIQSILVIVIVLSLIILIIFMVYRRYIRFKKLQSFHDEMDLMQFENNESKTLDDIVKRYALNEPVEILYSLRLFDEMAEKEMARILSSSMPSKGKNKYIDLLYQIRHKTYFSEEVPAYSARKNDQNKTDSNGENNSYNSSYKNQPAAVH